MKLALCTTVRGADSVLDFFVDYHLSIGFDVIFLFFDDVADNGIDRFAKRQNVVVYRSDEELQQLWKSIKYQKLYRKYIPSITTEVMARQNLNTAVAMELCRKHGYDWLLHIDSDELFYTYGRSIKDHFSSLSLNNIRIINYRNHESVPEKFDISNFFSENNLFKKNKAVLNPYQKQLVNKWFTKFDGIFFYFYANGKSAVRIDDDAIPDGVHFFTYKNRILRQLKFKAPIKKLIEWDEPCILHFPCCGFRQFYNKYRFLGNFSDKNFNKLPIKLPMHLKCRDIINNESLETAKEFYQSIFINYQLQNADLFLKEGVYFRVPLINSDMRNIKL